MGLDPKSKTAITLFLVLSWCFGAAVAAPDDAKPMASKPPQKAALDRSGESRKGKASYYGRKSYGKKMADGTRLNPQSNVAASKRLPLGTKAKVTNLENRKSAVVEIRDRGPYVKDRIIDVTPKTAEKLGMKEQGVARVEVKPIEVPQQDGTLKPGAAASETGQDRSKP